MQAEPAAAGQDAREIHELPRRTGHLQSARGFRVRIEIAGAADVGKRRALEFFEQGIGIRRQDLGRDPALSHRGPVATGAARFDEAEVDLGAA